MPHLVAAPDKFRGTATAAEVAAAAGRAARSAGWSADELPLADGGEGTLEVLWRALGGERRTVRVPGPLGDPVEAEWLFLASGLPRANPGDVARPPWGVARPAGERLDQRPVAVVESARAAGRALLPAPSGDDPLRARTDGVGALVLEAIDAGAVLVVIAVGGSATTDGGWGAVSAVGARERLGRASLLVACDVDTAFRAAAETFGPQKGATPAQVPALRARLDVLAQRYHEEFGVDVEALAGSGAGGGLAGGLAALGAALVPGFALVASLVDLDRRVAAADLVMTGEGRLDATSFAGKVVGGVLAARGGVMPALCVAGEIEEGVERFWAERPGRVDAVSLVSSVGAKRARLATADSVAEVVARSCRGRARR
ncbi:MAG TPA: glycerate kinase [Acidimicrobiales bacterium]|nr:glycerate kinase [Acidimicrobiales bacterium]